MQDSEGVFAPGRRMVLFTCMSSSLLTIVLLYMMSPFFQTYAEECCGASPSTVGLIFSALPFASFVSSFFMNDALGRFGAKKTMVWGLLLLGGSSMAFGLSRSIPMFVFWRVVQGVASALVNTAISTTMAEAYTGHDFAVVNAAQEVLGQVGFAVGPALGGALYEYFGFFAPFGVGAALHVVFVLFSFCLPEDKAIEGLDEPLVDEEGTKNATWWDVSYAPVLWMAGACVLAPGFNGAIEPTMAVHYGGALGIPIGTTMGLIFSLPAATSALGALIVPWLMEARGSKFVVLVGVFCLSLSAFALGITDPSAARLTGFPLAEDGSSWWSVGSTAMWVIQCSAILLLGFGTSLAWTPVLPEMMDSAAFRTAGKGLATTNAVSAMFNASAALGEGMGPAVGGFLNSTFGFVGTALLPAAVGIVFMIGMGVGMKPSPIHVEEGDAPLPGTGEVPEVEESAKPMLQRRASWTPSETGERTKVALRRGSTVSLQRMSSRRNSLS